MHRSLSHQATLSLPLSTSPLATVDHMYLQQQWTRHWIELTLQQALPITNLFLCLRTGVILCKLMNKLQSGAVPHIHYNECLSAKEENIRQFLKAGSKMGLHDSELFYVDDLLQGKNMNAASDLDIISIGGVGEYEEFHVLVKL
ncbi:calponin homology domain-containing protein [Chlamydoabsidia padenii]|nr:calponin homology domain-containing protein [Chlamydoabsidia padenii]